MRRHNLYWMSDKCQQLRVILRHKTAFFAVETVERKMKIQLKTSRKQKLWWRPRSEWNVQSKQTSRFQCAFCSNSLRWNISRAVFNILFGFYCCCYFNYRYCDCYCRSCFCFVAAHILCSNLLFYLLLDMVNDRYSPHYLNFILLIPICRSHLAFRASSFFMQKKKSNFSQI